MQIFSEVVFCFCLIQNDYFALIFLRTFISLVISLFSFLFCINLSYLQRKGDTAAS